MLYVPLGLACQHVWNDTFTLNNQPAFTVARAKVDRITGWRGLPVADEGTANRRGQVGETAYPVSPRGKDMIYEGRLQGTSPVSLETLQGDMTKAFGERSALGFMRVAPQSAHFAGGAVWVFYARVMSFECDEDQLTSPWHHRGPWQREYQLGLRLFDPRFYSNDVRSSGAVASAATYTANNQGSAPTEPTITIAVPAAATAVMENTTTGRSLKFDDLPAGSLVVDFHERTAKVGATDVSAHLDLAESDWWDANTPGLVPGNNNIYASAGAWSMTWRDASW